MKQPIWSIALAILVFLNFVWGCNNSSTADKATATASTTLLLTDSIDSAVLGRGRPIDNKEVKHCLDTFLTTMAAYNITGDSVPQPVTKCPQKTYFVTAYESFRASDFNYYLDSVINKHDSAARGANLDLHMSFGIVTQEFVKDHPDAAGLLGRIVIFVIPKERKDSAALKSIASGGTTDPSSSYEIGGLAP